MSEAEAGQVQSSLDAVPPRVPKGDQDRGPPRGSFSGAEPDGTAWFSSQPLPAVPRAGRRGPKPFLLWPGQLLHKTPWSHPRREMKEGIQKLRSSKNSLVLKTFDLT